MTWRTRAAALTREPLVHFLAAGAAVFFLLAGRAPDLGERRILVNEAVASRLAQRWNDTYRRPPSADELNGLIADYVRDQVYYREALALGLDKDDEVVMKRMRNKMVALSASEADTAAPSDADLQALLDKDPIRYAREAQFGFEQVFLGPDAPQARKAAPRLIEELKNGKKSSELGQPIPLPSRFDSAATSAIAAQFGDHFADTLRTLPQGRWTGPVASGLGLHLVKMTARSLPAPPRLADVRQVLENDWRAQARSKAEDDDYRRLLDGYDVVIELPK